MHWTLQKNNVVKSCFQQLMSYVIAMGTFTDIAKTGKIKGCSRHVELVSISKFSFFD
jgi:hypothetical protein